MSQQTSSGNNLCNNNGGLYSIYKHATHQVFEWAAATEFDKKAPKKKPKKGKAKSCGRGKNHHYNSNTNDTLTSKIRTLLKLSCVELPDGDDDVDAVGAAISIMPPTVLQALQEAIRLREKMSIVYQQLSTASPQYLEGHLWLIDQLKLVLKGQQRLAIGSKMHQEDPVAEMTVTDQDTATTTTSLQSTLGERFAVLSVEEDHEYDDEPNMQEEKKEEEQERSGTPRAAIGPISQQLLKQEETSFAIACATSDLIDTRQSIRHVWKQWAQRPLTSVSDESGKEEAGPQEELNKDIPQQDTNEDENDIRSSDSSEEELVVLSGEMIHETNELVSRSIFSDFCIRSVERLANETLLSFETDLLEVVIQTNDMTTDMSGDNDNTLQFLKKIHQVLVAHYDAVFKKLEPGSERSMLSQNNESLELALQERDISSFTKQIIVFDLLPRLRPVSTALSGILERKAMLPVAMFILAIFDAALVQHHETTATSDSSSNSKRLQKLVTSVVQIQFDRDTYEIASGWMWHGEEAESYILPLLDRTTSLVDTLSPLACLLPYQSAQLLFHSLKSHLSASLCFAISTRDDLLQIVHIYHMLRREGFLGRIAAIEDTLISVFTQKVFFGCGLPRQTQYVEAFQLCLGNDAVHKVPHRTRRNGKGGQAISLNSKTKRAFWGKRDNAMNFHDVSSLVQLESLENVPLVNRTSFFNQVQQMVQEELPAVFFSPLMDTIIQIMAMRERWLYVTKDQDSTSIENPKEAGLVITQANEFCSRTQQMQIPIQIPIPAMQRITYWAATLANGRPRSIPGSRPFTDFFMDARDPGLKLLADSFCDVFDVEEVVDGGGVVGFRFNTTAALDKDQMALFWKWS